MEIAPKLIIAALLSLSIGIAAATPLLVSELDIIPWTTHVQGPTASFDLDVVYSNFTVSNPDAAITKTGGPTISYFAVVNVTNPSEYPALLLGVDFWAGQKIQNITGQGPFGMNGNWSTGEGWEAAGAWVDGVWYNVTWVDGSYPYFNENGTMTESPFPVPTIEGHWMEGVQLYERTVHTDATGTNTAIYMNMNGTWADVTGRITVDMPENGPTYSMTGSVASQNLFFQQVPAKDYNFSDESLGYTSTRNVRAGEGAFNDLFAPGQSRLIVLAGSWEVDQAWASGINPVATLQSGSIQMKIMTHTVVDVNPDLGNNTILDTWKDATIIQQINLVHVGGSFIYNTVLGDNQMFQLDQYGVEAFIVPRS